MIALKLWWNLLVFKLRRRLHFLYTRVSHFWFQREDFGNPENLPKICGHGIRMAARYTQEIFGNPAKRISRRYATIGSRSGSGWPTGGPDRGCGSGWWAARAEGSAASSGVGASAGGRYSRENVAVLDWDGDTSGSLTQSPPPFPVTLWLPNCFNPCYLSRKAARREILRSTSAYSPTLQRAQASSSILLAQARFNLTARFGLFARLSLTSEGSQQLLEVGTLKSGC